MARQPIEVGDSNVEGVNLAIVPGVDLAGRIRVDGKEEADFGHLNVYLQPRDSTMNVSGDEVKADGAFTLQNIPPDNYSIVVYGIPEGLYLKSIRLGEEDVLGPGLNLSGGAVAGKLDVVLSGAGGQLDGLVSDGRQKASKAATVVLVPEPARRSQTYLYKVITTDQNGRFTMRGIAPGEYKVFAWEDVESGAYQDPDFLRPLDNLGQSISIRENGSETAQVKLIPAE